MNLRALLSIPLGLSSFFSTRVASFGARQASTMTIDPAKLNGGYNPDGDYDTCMR